MEYITDFPIGTTNRVTKTTRLGSVARFTDQTRNSVGINPILSGMPTYARIVLNGSGGTLAPGALCRWDTATNGPGMEVDGLAAISSTQLPAGVVDPWITGTVAAAETFLLFYYGPAKFLSTTGTAVAVDELLTLGASGRAVVYAEASADAEDTLFRCGKSLAVVASGTAAGTLFRGFVDCRF
jgi:hypothetical protein